MGNGTNANPDETFMIAASDFVFKCGKNCFTMRIGPLKLISISSSDAFEASSFVVNIDLTHDAGVVDQNAELRKLFGDLFVKSGDRFRIGNVASKGVNFWKGRFRTVHLSLIAARDKNRVTKCRELFGEFVTDATGTTGDQNRIAREFHN